MSVTFPVFWRMLRPHTLSASFVPVAVGSAYALKAADVFSPLRALLMLAACLFIQIATNLFNEYYDYARGLDTRASVGIGGTIVRDGLSPRFVLAIALGFYAAAAALGLALACLSSYWLLPVGAFCMLCGYLYTGGPYPIAASPFGEAAAGLLLGSLVICLSFFLQTDYVTADVFLISLPVALLIGAILTANNIRDRVGDAAGGRKTLVILLGHRRGVVFLAALFALAILWSAGLCFRSGFGFWFLLPLLSIPPAWRSVRLFRCGENQPPPVMLPAMRRAAQTNTVYGLAYAAAFLLAAFFPPA
ncbi:MAG: 1,4-dihydroxy-2-naphthoate polyprenyltransferase [Gracilibacteraceae bacterium]|jgi:1,4-dihydroxy-2-naphthoate octaprenyltransferase|nr:1,4-dihydroxy-2-naphthoate polyprenyltransferase [Gracilibacteraceae bacterium]